MGNVAHVSVHNQGASISSADIGQLFQPYGRLQAANKQEGSGLGLYITKCIVEAHGGSLRLEPRAEGSESEQGTMFSFDLPMGERRVACRNRQVITRLFCLFEKPLKIAVCAVGIAVILSVYRGISGG